ncbi:MAG: hypothetical protein Q8O93_01345 [bacterium]|nr:hypothetical protein [bacterium]
MNEKFFNSVSQLAIPLLTIGGQIVYAFKFPQYGLLLNLAAQPFWIYSSWKAYRNAGQIGILITTVIFTIVTVAGLVNYWVL